MACMATRQSRCAGQHYKLLLWKNPIFVEETILEKLGCDNKPHYYEAYKAGTLVASGWGEHFIRSEKSFSLRQIEGYGMEDLQEVRYIIWQDKDMILKEYTLKET